MTERLVVVVDDNAANRELYSDLLEMVSFAAIALDGGEQVVQVVRENRPGLVLMDMNMPGHSGMDVFAHMRAALGDASPPVLALTASILPDLAKNLCQAGFAGLVCKPCGVATFIEAVTWGMAEGPKSFRVFTD
ncbi:MAG: hypothetical protein FD176_974 [Rhodospirillaceae bacterium]|nr:MAG: hypothetical protein FD176_974 [Rhodospirillaceae bacterium]TNC97763.1 MAG: rpFC [Stygiobacter sp.]